MVDRYLDRGSEVIIASATLLTCTTVLEVQKRQCPCCCWWSCFVGCLCCCCWWWWRRRGVVVWWSGSLTGVRGVVMTVRRTILREPPTILSPAKTVFVASDTLSPKLHADQPSHVERAIPSSHCRLAKLTNPKPYTLNPKPPKPKPLVPKPSAQNPSCSTSRSLNFSCERSTCCGGQECNGPGVRVLGLGFGAVLQGPSFMLGMRLWSMFLCFSTRD